MFDDIAKHSVSPVFDVPKKIAVGVSPSEFIEEEDNESFPSYFSQNISDGNEKTDVSKDALVPGGPLVVGESPCAEIMADLILEEPASVPEPIDMRYTIDTDEDDLVLIGGDILPPNTGFMSFDNMTFENAQTNNKKNQLLMPRSISISPESESERVMNESAMADIQEQASLTAVLQPQSSQQDIVIDYNDAIEKPVELSLRDVIAHAGPLGSSDDDTPKAEKQIFNAHVREPHENIKGKHDAAVVEHIMGGIALGTLQHTFDFGHHSTTKEANPTVFRIGGVEYTEGIVGYSSVDHVPAARTISSESSSDTVTACSMTASFKAAQTYQDLSIDIHADLTRCEEDATQGDTQLEPIAEPTIEHEFMEEPEYEQLEEQQQYQHTNDDENEPDLNYIQPDFSLISEQYIEPKIDVHTNLMESPDNVIDFEEHLSDENADNISHFIYDVKKESHQDVSSSISAESESEFQGYPVKKQNIRQEDAAKQQKLDLLKQVSSLSSEEHIKTSSSSDISVEPTLLAATYDLDSGSISRVVATYDLSPESIEKTLPVCPSRLKTILSTPDDEVFECVETSRETIVAGDNVGSPFEIISAEDIQHDQTTTEKHIVSRLSSEPESSSFDHSSPISSSEPSDFKEPMSPIDVTGSAIDGDILQPDIPIYILPEEISEEPLLLGNQEPYIHTNGPTELDYIPDIDQPLVIQVDLSQEIVESDPALSHDEDEPNTESITSAGVSETEIMIPTQPSDEPTNVTDSMMEDMIVMRPQDRMLASDHTLYEFEMPSEEVPTAVAMTSSIELVRLDRDDLLMSSSMHDSTTISSSVWDESTGHEETLREEEQLTSDKVAPKSTESETEKPSLKKHIVGEDANYTIPPFDLAETLNVELSWKEQTSADVSNVVTQCSGSFAETGNYLIEEGTDNIVDGDEKNTSDDESDEELVALAEDTDTEACLEMRPEGLSIDRPESPIPTGTPEGWDIDFAVDSPKVELTDSDKKLSDTELQEHASDFVQCVLANVKATISSHEICYDNSLNEVPHDQDLIDELEKINSFSTTIENDFQQQRSLESPDSDDIPCITITQHLHEETHQDDYPMSYSSDVQDDQDILDDKPECSYNANEESPLLTKDDDQPIGNTEESNFLVKGYDAHIPKESDYSDTDENSPLMKVTEHSFLVDKQVEKHHGTTCLDLDEMTVVKRDIEAPEEILAICNFEETSSVSYGITDKSNKDFVEHVDVTHIKVERVSFSTETDQQALHLTEADDLISPEDFGDSSSVDSFATVVNFERYEDEDQKMQDLEDRMAEVASMTSSIHSDIHGALYSDEHVDIFDVSPITVMDVHAKNNELESSESTSSFSDQFEMIDRSETDTVSVRTTSEGSLDSPEEGTYDVLQREEFESMLSQRELQRMILEPEDPNMIVLPRRELEVVKEESPEGTSSSSERLDEGKTSSSEHVYGSPDTIDTSDMNRNSYTSNRIMPDRDDESISSSLLEFERLEQEARSFDSLVTGSPRARIQDVMSISSSLAEFETLESTLAQSDSMTNFASESAKFSIDAFSSSSLNEFEKNEREVVSPPSPEKMPHRNNNRFESDDSMLFPIESGESSSSSSLTEFEQLEMLTEMSVDRELQIEAQKVVNLLESGTLVSDVSLSSTMSYEQLIVEPMDISQEKELDMGSSLEHESPMPVPQPLDPQAYILGLSLLDSPDKNYSEVSSKSLPEHSKMDKHMRETSRNVELFENSPQQYSCSDIQIAETEAVRISRQLQEVIKTSSGSDVDEAGADIDSLNSDEDGTAIAIDLVPAEQTTREIDADSLQDSEQLSIGNLDSDSLQDPDSIMQISAESFDMDPSSSMSGLGLRDTLMQQSTDSTVLMERSMDSLENDPTPKAVDFQLPPVQTSDNKIMESSIDSLEQEQCYVEYVDLQPQPLPPQGFQQQDLSDSGSFSLSQSSSMMQSMTSSCMLIQSMQSSGCRDMMTISQDSIEDLQTCTNKTIVTISEAEEHTHLKCVKLDQEGNVTQMWDGETMGDDTNHVISPDVTSAMSFNSSRELSLVSDPVNVYGTSLETDPVSPTSSASSTHSDNCYCANDGKRLPRVTDSRGTLVCVCV